MEWALESGGVGRRRPGRITGGRWLQTAGARAVLGDPTGTDPYCRWRPGKLPLLRLLFLSAQHTFSCLRGTVIFAAPPRPLILKVFF